MDTYTYRYDKSLNGGAEATEVQAIANAVYDTVKADYKTWAESQGV